jgi:protein phosphatase 2C family protein 2/3
LVSGYGANTNQGIVRNYNEDRVAIILNIMKPKSKNFEASLWPKCSFFGIYDGHGGAVCADFLRDYLHQFIIKDDHFPQNPIQALRNGFREAERLFMEFAESQEKEAGEIDRSGSCAVVILIIDDMCYCANTGDSRAIMSADGGEKLFLLSTDHKPTDEVEMKRIIENGGRIYQNSQIIQTNPALGEAGKQVVYGPHRVFPGRLSVSRTVGDIEAKLEKYEGNQNVVIADPDVTAFEIKDNHDFIVIGCDGVFDKLSSKDAIHIGWQKVLMEANKSGVKKIDLE